MTANNAPIACTLGGTDYAERLAWIASLNRDGLLSHERHEAALELRYASTVRHRVRELVRKESECCAFLTFALDESRGDVRLTITVPARSAKRRTCSSSRSSRPSRPPRRDVAPIPPMAAS